MVVYTITQFGERTTFDVESKNTNDYIALPGQKSVHEA